MSLLLEKLSSLGLSMPAAPTPGGNYKPFHQHGNLLFLAGVISVTDGVVTSGKVGAALTIEQGYAAAQICALNQLAAIQLALGSLDRVKAIVSVNGYVNCVPEFPDPPLVINGASDLFVKLWGENGKHVRAAVGVASLPKNAAVEIQMTVEI
jgi:enamine deaminase RidA (YjgF/YER057c/UK114 family)